MSGIYGVFYRNGSPVSEAMLTGMRDAMSEWGPDGRGQWIGKNMGMGTVLMYNTPESCFEQQPVRDTPSARYILCADTRIDNREELCDSLKVPAVERATLSDSALLLIAFLRWGENCPDHIVGAYAFAIWDSVEQRLFLVRDHMGFRPLYYYEDSEKFVFASDVSAIIAMHGVVAQLDPFAVSAARFQYTPYLKEHSLYGGIYKVLPAGSLLITPGKFHKNIYWQADSFPSIRYKTNSGYAEAMSALVHEAVQSCLRTQFAVGSHLSGGLDSSAVTIIASRMLRQRGDNLADTFTWSPQPRAEDFPLTDERQHIEQLCKSEGLSCTYSGLTVDDVIGIWLSDMRTRPQDVMVSEVAVRRSAAGQGIRTILSGWGGDEFSTFNGRGFFSEQLLRFKWLNLLSEMRSQHFVRKTSYRRMLVDHTLLPVLPDKIYSWRRNLLPGEILQDPDVSEQGKRLYRMLAVRCRPRATMRRNQLNSLQLGWLTYRIESWTARSIEQQIEYRYPLLDRRLLEFCLGLPAEQFVRNGWNRVIFRNAMSAVLPESICWHRNNKAEVAAPKSHRLIMEQASVRFAQMCDAKEIDADLVSSMWRDNLLPGL